MRHETMKGNPTRHARIRPAVEVWHESTGRSTRTTSQHMARSSSGTRLCRAASQATKQKIYCTFSTSMISKYKWFISLFSIVKFNSPMVCITKTYGQTQKLHMIKCKPWRAAPVSRSRHYHTHRHEEAVAESWVCRTMAGMCRVTTEDC